MNLVPTNSYCRSLMGDTSTLPTIVGMSSVILEDGGGNIWVLQGRS